MIPYSTQYIQDDDIDSVVNALSNDFITQGTLVETFENEIAKYIGVKFAIVFNSATSALNIAYKILDLKGNDFLTTALTFCATSNMMIENGVNPVFCDIDSNGNISPKSIAKNITNKTKAVVSVDFAGNSVDVDTIVDICKANNLYFISDSSHSFGGEYKGRKVGNFADMTIFSFHAIKPITTIEGGAIVTNNEEFYNKAKLLCSHGIIKKKLWNSELACVGYNFRLSDVACALGLSQLKKLDSFIAKRNEIALFYDSFFKNNLDFTTLKIPSFVKSTHHLYPILLDKKFIGKKEDIFSSLVNTGVCVQVHYKPLYQYDLYRKLAFSCAYSCRIDDFYKSELSIPIHQKMDLKDANFVANKLLETIKKYH